MSVPRHHFPDDVLRGFAVGTAPEATRLAVTCHLAFCEPCRSGAALHEAILTGLSRLVAAGDDPGHGPGAAKRERLLDELRPQPAPPPARAPSALPADLPDLPEALREHLRRLPDARWRRLVPGIRAIDLGLPEVWRARLVAFRPGIPIPAHDHDGAEHTVIFQGGLDDDDRHLERGDAATMTPGETHSQRSAPGAPCVALIVSERAPRPLTMLGHLLKTITRS